MKTEDHKKLVVNAYKKSGMKTDKYKLTAFDNEKIFGPAYEGPRFAVQKAEEITLSKVLHDLEAAEKEIADMNELLLDAFATSCSTKDGYDHCCISTWEMIQAHLIAVGKIKIEECYRK